MTAAPNRAAKEENRRRGDPRGDARACRWAEPAAPGNRTSAPRPRAHRGAWRAAREAKNSRLGLATPARVLASGQWRAKAANGIRKAASFTVKSWCADTSAQGGGKDLQDIADGLFQNNPNAAREPRDGEIPINDPRVFEKNGDQYRLTSQARDVLDPLYKRFGTDLSKISVTFDSDILQSETVGNHITLGQDFVGGRLTMADTLLHEVTHAAQYQQLGRWGMTWRGFTDRVRFGWGEERYDIGPGLKVQTLQTINIVDSRFSLEASASQFAGLGVPGVKGMF